MIVQHVEATDDDARVPVREGGTQPLGPHLVDRRRNGAARGAEESEAVRAASLLRAAKAGDTEGCRACVARGSQCLSAQDHLGRTALHYAAYG